ncbi:MAG: hypothetical protein WC506_01980 [Candidatus Micrarchaeia archaeon]
MEKKWIAFAAFLVLSSLASPLGAQGSDMQQVDLSYNPVNSLISVSSDFTNQTFLNGYEYLNNMNVSWAIPNDSLRNLNSDKVNVKVNAWANTKEIEFDAGGGRAGAVSFTLTCIVQNGSCAPDSELERAVRIYSTHRKETEQENETIFVNASLATGDSGILGSISGFLGTVASGLNISVPGNMSANATIGAGNATQQIEMTGEGLQQAAQNISSQGEQAAQGISQASGNRVSPELLTSAAIVFVLVVLVLLFLKFK